LVEEQAMKSIRRVGKKLVRVAYDCPWHGHQLDPSFVVRNSAAPQIEGRRCVKCGCLIYLQLEVSAIAGPNGESLITGVGVTDGGSEGSDH
jgi:hypothetical protein